MSATSSPTGSAGTPSPKSRSFVRGLRLLASDALMHFAAAMDRYVAAMDPEAEAVDDAATTTNELNKGPRMESNSSADGIEGGAEGASVVRDEITVTVENASMASSSQLANRDFSAGDHMEQALIGSMVGAIDTTREPESSNFSLPGQSAVLQGSLFLPVSAESHSVKLGSSGDASEFGRLPAVTAFLQDEDADDELQQTMAQRDRTGLLSSGEYVHVLCEAPDTPEEEYGYCLENVEIFARLDDLGYTGKNLSYLWTELTRQQDDGRVFRSIACIDKAVQELLLQSKCSDSPTASLASNYTVESESADKHQFKVLKDFDDVAGKCINAAANSDDAEDMTMMLQADSNDIDQETVLEEDSKSQEFSEDAHKQSHEAVRGAAIAASQAMCAMQVSLQAHVEQHADCPMKEGTASKELTLQGKHKSKPKKNKGKGTRQRSTKPIDKEKVNVQAAARASRNTHNNIIPPAHPFYIGGTHHLQPLHIGGSGSIATRGDLVSQAQQCGAVFGHFQQIVQSQQVQLETQHMQLQAQQREIERLHCINSTNSWHAGLQHVQLRAQQTELEQSRHINTMLARQVEQLQAQLQLQAKAMQQMQLQVAEIELARKDSEAKATKALHEQQAQLQKLQIEAKRLYEANARQQDGSHERKAEAETLKKLKKAAKPVKKLDRKFVSRTLKRLNKAAKPFEKLERKYAAAKQGPQGTIVTTRLRSVQRRVKGRGMGKMRKPILNDYSFPFVWHVKARIPLKDKCSFITVHMCFLSKFNVRGSTTPVRATYLLNLSIRGSKRSVKSTSK